MTNYALPIDPQGPLSPYPPSLQTAEWEVEEQSRGWQIVPPVVTGGRLAAVRGNELPHTSRNRSEPQGAYIQDIREARSAREARQPMASAPAQEGAPLFRVSFCGPDQQWYSVSARVGQGGTGVATRIPDVPEPPMLHPAWQQDLASGPMKRVERPLQNTPQPVSYVAPEKGKQEDESKDFILQFIQPGLVGLMDGSVSTLAPIFAVAFATHQSFTTFLVGMASALGAGISMAFSEALSDDGDLTGRGNPFVRGGVTGLMTFVSGAGHALPFLVSNLQLALVLAYVVVAVELFVIAAIRHKFFGTSWWLSIVQVVGGGALVFATALLLGSA